MSRSTFSKTPSVKIYDNRSRMIRDVSYYRHPDTTDITDEYITHHQYDSRGFLTQSSDPRLSDKNLVNIDYINDLAGNVLRMQGADNGSSVTLNDSATRPFLKVNAEGITTKYQYEAHDLPGRLKYIAETGTENITRITARFIYAGNTPEEQELNLAGHCICQYDTSGMTQLESISLTGVSLSITRYLLKDLDNPDNVVNWQSEDTLTLNEQLGSERWTSLMTADATGALLTTRDAAGNTQRMAFDIASLLKASWLTITNGPEQSIIKSIVYSAAGRKLREEHGNGIVISYTYESETQRLTGIKTERPQGHVAGAKVLQYLRYSYDPVGNMLSVYNVAEETRFWKNQKVVPENTYVYDSLYQLIKTSGREMAYIAQQSSNLPSASLFDAVTYTNYTRTYAYDNAGNLTQIRHSSPASSNTYTTAITLSDKSNRGVISSQTENPTEVDAFFTPGGLQRVLQPGQALLWSPREELQKVILVQRDDAEDDSESYRYDINGQRVFKATVRQTDSAVQLARSIYLQGLELKTVTANSLETERLYIIKTTDAGQAQVRCLHWENGKPEGLKNDMLRYSYGNLTESSVLEIDGDGNLISQEEYYPFGGTAVLTTRNYVEVDYKTIRYSGKERDTTGLYWYGYRYYQPWIGRWLSADPAGVIDGLNLYKMVGNNPLVNIDESGLFTLNITSILKSLITKWRVNRSYQAMAKGSLWDGKIKNEGAMLNEGRANLTLLRQQNYPLTKEAYEFAERFKKLDFNLVHYTSSDIQASSGVIYSKKELYKRGIKFSERNTTTTDIQKLGTDDFVFFSLGVGDASGKERSRFGANKYQIPLAKAVQQKYVKHGHLTINDTLKYSERQTSESRLTGIFKMRDVNELKSEVIASKAVETVFDYNNFNEGLALRIIGSTSNLSVSGQRFVYGSRTDADFDQIISLFYRPQFLVPKKFNASNMVKQ